MICIYTTAISPTSSQDNARRPRRQSHGQPPGHDQSYRPPMTPDASPPTWHQRAGRCLWRTGPTPEPRPALNAPADGRTSRTHDRLSIWRCQRDGAHLAVESCSVRTQQKTSMNASMIRFYKFLAFPASFFAPRQSPQNGDGTETTACELSCLPNWPQYLIRYADQMATFLEEPVSSIIYDSIAPYPSVPGSAICHTLPRMA